MAVEPIDLAGTFSMSDRFVERLERHLNENEMLLGKRLLEVFLQKFDDASTPRLPLPSDAHHLSLNKAVKALESRQVTKNELTKAVVEASSIFWRHLEFLEGAVLELFLQVAQVNFDDWNGALEANISKIQQLLKHHLEETQWALDHVEEFLKKQKEEEEGFSFNFSKLKDKFTQSTLLDKTLWTNTESCIKTLDEEHLKFKLRYQYFLDLKDQVIVSKVQLAHFNVLYRLDVDLQQKFIKLYELLKFFSLNLEVKALPDAEPAVAIRRLMSPEKAFSMFKEYYHQLYRYLFEKARAIKNFSGEWMSDEGKEIVLHDIKKERKELLTLAVTIESYQSFLQKTDPNPYVRSRLGISEWTLSEGSSKYSHLVKFGYDLKTLDRYFDQLEKSVSSPSKTSASHLEHCHQEVLMVLHQMGQPLLSKRAMELKANRFITLLKEVNELGSFNEKSVEYCSEWFSRALRADWRYHLLHGNLEFHELFAIHKGLCEPIDDRLHHGRINKFKKIIHELEEWLKHNDTLKHARDIELDLSDIKGYLQDFYAQVQRAFSKESDNSNPAYMLQFIEVFAAELLDYRYLFGQFFYHLHDENTEQKLMRDQLLFVDQYFEAVEQKLAEAREELGQD